MTTDPFEGLKESEVNILLVFFAVERPTYTNLRGFTGYNEVRIRGPLGSLVRRNLVRQVGRTHFELVDKQRVRHWFLAHRPDSLPPHYR